MVNFLVIHFRINTKFLYISVDFHVHPKVIQSTTPLQSSSSAQDGLSQERDTAPETCRQPWALCVCVSAHFQVTCGFCLLQGRKESLQGLLNARKGPQFHSCKISFLAAMQLSEEEEPVRSEEMSGCFKCRSCSNSRSLLEVCDMSLA